MQLKKLDASFYIENTHLHEALDNHKGEWEKGKKRGYGVIIVEFNYLTFAIPLRSNLTHKAVYVTKEMRHQKEVVKKGLDFSKALLISKPSYISSDNFNIPPDEHTLLQEKEHFISAKFGKYIERYIHAVRKPDKNILNSPEYRYTTLQYYHVDLGIKSV